MAEINILSSNFLTFFFEIEMECIWILILVSFILGTSEKGSQLQLHAFFNRKQKSPQNV